MNDVRDFAGMTLREALDSLGGVAALEWERVPPPYKPRKHHWSPSRQRRYERRHGVRLVQTLRWTPAE
jgi:hypothetical protein